MATGNFYTMENFPLYAYLEDDWDWFEEEEFCSFITEEVNELNCDLTFFKVSLKSGYYAGVQFYVDDLHNLDRYGWEYWSNDDCNYEFDMCRSKAIRKYQSEINKVNRWLAKTAKEYGFEKLVVSARFSNGEVMYNRA